MPEGMPGNVSQGFIFRAVGEYLNDLRQADDTATLNEIKGKLEAVDGNDDSIHEIVDLIKSYVPGTLRPADKGHLEEHWFGGSQGVGRGDKIWWATAQPIDPVIRDGFVDLIEKLVGATTNSSVNCFWVCAGHAMEVVTLESELPTNDKHFTTLILTPSVPIGRRYRTPRFKTIYKFDGDEPITVTRGDGTSPAETKKGGGTGARSITVIPKKLEKK